MMYLKQCFIALTFLSCQFALALELTDYQTTSYRNTRSSSSFNHFVSYNQTVYIGAIDALYQLGEDFTRQQVVNTAAEECEGGKNTCPNYNKILLVHEANETLITCGSASGYCAARNLTDITQDLMQSRSPIVPSGTLTTEAIIAPGPSDNNAHALYVAATYDEMRYQLGVHPVRRRLLTDSRLFGEDREGSVIFASSSLIAGGFAINYMKSFTVAEFSYFVQSQVEDFCALSPDANTYVSKISRFCHSNGNLQSYSHILLQCQGTNGDYNLIQAVHLGLAGEDLATSLGLNSTDNILYGIFAKNEGPDGDIASNQSALCIFKISDIEAAFIDAIIGCLSGGDAYENNYLFGGDDGCSRYQLPVSIMIYVIDF